MANPMERPTSQHLFFYAAELDRIATFFFGLYHSIDFDKEHMSEETFDTIYDIVPDLRRWSKRLIAAGNEYRESEQR